MDRRFYESPDYKAGYLAGFQQGYAEGEEPILTFCQRAGRFMRLAILGGLVLLMVKVLS